MATDVTVVELNFPEIEKMVRESFDIFEIVNCNVVGSGVGPAALSLAMASVGSDWIQVNIHHPDLEKTHGWVWVRPTNVSKLASGYVNVECDLLHRNLIENLPMWAKVKIRYDVVNQRGKVTLPYVL